MGKFWNIEGPTFFIQGAYGEREVSVAANSDRSLVCICCDPDDDNQAVQITTSVEDAKRLAREILNVAEELETRQSRMEVAAE